MALLIIGRNLIPVHKILNDLQNPAVLLHPQQAVLAGDNAVGPPRIKSRDDIPVLVPPKGELGLVAVAPGMLHADDGKHGKLLLLKTADPHQVVDNLAFLKPQLGLIAHGLQLTAPARTSRRAGRLCPIRRWGKHLHKPGEAVILFHLHSPRADHIPDHCVLHKPDIAVQTAHPGTVLIQILYGQGKLLILPKLPSLLPGFQGHLPP